MGPGSFAMDPCLKSAREHVAGRGTHAAYAQAQGPYLHSATQMRALALKSFPELNGGFVGLLATAYLHLLLGGKVAEGHFDSSHD